MKRTTPLTYRINLHVDVPRAYAAQLRGIAERQEFAGRMTVTPLLRVGEDPASEHGRYRFSYADETVWRAAHELVHRSTGVPVHEAESTLTADITETSALG